MKVITGKFTGFCGGVTRSVKNTEKLIKDKGHVYCLGELVHNKQVIETLENKGMETITSLDEIADGSTVIFRAHGVPVSVYEEAKNKHLEIVDLTCQNVLAIHKEAQKLAKEGYFIILLAQKSHPEAIGTISFCGKNSLVMESLTDIESVIKAVQNSGIKKVSIIAQTTYSLAKFNLISQKLKERLENYEVLIKNTICNATELRQEEAHKLATQVEAMIIVGGKNSSNTQKLYEIASADCTHCEIIENASDLTLDYSKYEKVGVIAGASTPQKSIDEVLEKLKTFEK